MPPPPGGATTSRDFFILPSPPRNTVQTTTHDDIIFASADKSPSHPFNLVGRRLLLSEKGSRYPSPKRPRVGLLSLAAPADGARANFTGDFAAKNI